MRISDWSSDVCSSDLPCGVSERALGHEAQNAWQERAPECVDCAHDECRIECAADRSNPPDDDHDKCRYQHRLAQDRKSVVTGKRVSVRVDFGGRSIINKNKRDNIITNQNSIQQ